MESTKYIDRTKYIGMDVHKETVSIAVMNSTRQAGDGSIIETKTATILQFTQGLSGDLLVFPLGQIAEVADSRRVSKFAKYVSVE